MKKGQHNITITLLTTMMTMVNEVSQVAQITTFRSPSSSSHRLTYRSFYSTRVVFQICMVLQNVGELLDKWRQNNTNVSYNKSLKIITRVTLVKSVTIYTQIQSTVPSLQLILTTLKSALGKKTESDTRKTQSCVNRFCEQQKQLCFTYM